MPWSASECRGGCVRVREGCMRVRVKARGITTNMPVFLPNVSQTGPPNTEPNIEPNVMMLCVVAGHH